MQVIDALFLRARCYYEKGDLDKALDDAKRALSQGYGSGPRLQRERQGRGFRYRRHDLL